MGINSSYRILIVDDELAIAEMCESILIDLGYEVIGIANTYEEGIEKIALEKPDLVILDIDLNQEKNGIDLAVYIKEKLRVPFLYVSSYADISTVSKAAKTAPEAYLIKPFTNEDLFTTIEIIRAKKEVDQTIHLNTGTSQLKVPANDVSLVKSDNIYIEVHVDQKKHIVRSSLENFLNENPNPNFVRIHRSYIVNLLKVNSFSRQHVIVGDIKCPISRSYKQALFQRFSS
ncbi:MAG: response regulator [Cyclobacteriaceae bacterium]